LIVAPNDREVRIEIGDALSVMISNRAAASIIDNEILPSFREGRMSAGIIAGVNAMIYQANRPLMAPKSDSDYSVEASNSALQVEEPSRIDLSWLRAYAPSREHILVGVLVLFGLFVFYKLKLWRPLEMPDHPDSDYSGRTVYRNDRSSNWFSSSRHRHDRDHRSGGFGGFGSSSSASRSSGFSGSGSSRSFGGSSGSSSSGRSSGGFGGRGASGRW
jgi:uncharacterized protein